RTATAHLYRPSAGEPSRAVDPGRTDGGSGCRVGGAFLSAAPTPTPGGTADDPSDHPRYRRGDRRGGPDRLPEPSDPLLWGFPGICRPAGGVSVSFLPGGGGSPGLKVHTGKGGPCGFGTNAMWEMVLHYDFMRRAVLAGLIIGLISPLVGIFLVVRRLSLIADALAHVTLSGVAAGLLLQKHVPWLQSLNPLHVGAMFSVGGAMFVEQLRWLYRTYQELAIPVVLSGGVGLGVVLISAADGFNVDVAGYLFGSILAVGEGELGWIVVVAALVLAVIFLFHKELFALSFDEESAVVSGIPHRWINTLFSFAVALVIAASIRVVGILLVSALMTLPVAAALQIAGSFRQTLLYSLLFSETAVLCGLAAAYYLDWSSGGTIVLVSVLILVGILAAKRIRRLRILKTRRSDV